MYSISTILHPRVDKKGRQKIQIMVIYKRCRVYLKTDFRVPAGLQNPKINAIVKKQMSQAEDKLIDAIGNGLTAEGFKTLFKGSEKKVYLSDFFSHLQESLNLSPGRMRHYKVVAQKVGPHVTFSDISVKWLLAFQKSLSHLDQNTVNSQMKLLKSVLNKASAEGYINKEKFEAYKPPPYKQKLVDYLTEKEIFAFEKIVKAINDKSKKTAGYYFLLSCYTGWRISDAKRFDKSMITGDNVVLRAKKNGRIVSMPIVTRMKEIIKYVTKNPFNLSEERVRIFVKQIARDAGIEKRIKYHTSRHSYAMLLRSNGFDRETIAEKIGDSPLIAGVYDVIENEPLNKKIRERLG